MADTISENRAPDRPASAPAPPLFGDAVEAVYEDGVIKPRTPLALAPGTALQLQVIAAPPPGQPPNHSDPPQLLVSRLPGADPADLLADIARRPWRLASGAAAVALTATLLWLLQRQPPLPSYTWTFGLWGGTIGLYLAAVAPTRRRPTGWWHRPGNRTIGLALAALLLLAGALRLWHLGTLPPTLGGDEGSQGIEALNVLGGAINNPFSTGWLNVPTMSFYFNAPTIGLLGNTALALRLPWALVGMATVPIVYGLVAQLHGRTTGLLTAGLLATYHYHIHFSRLGSNQVADALFVALALLFLYRGSMLHSRLDWALCGVTTGLAQYFYAGARLSALIVLASAALLIARERPGARRASAWGAAIMAGGALLTAAPMLQYALRFPNEYNARLNAVGIFQTDWIARTQALTGQSVAQLLTEQFVRAVLAYNYYPDTTLWYGLGQPLFDRVSGMLMLLGMGYCLLRPLDLRLFPMLLWWWGGIVLGGALTEGPPASQRLITTAVPALFFVALALVRGGRLIVQPWRSPRRWRWLAGSLAAVALALSANSIWLYFADFTPRLIYGGFNAVVATELGSYAHSALGPGTRMYFFGAPRMYIGFGSIGYLAPEVEGVDIVDPLSRPIERALVPDDKAAAFVFLPERRAELELVRQTFPGGHEQDVLAPTGDQLLYTLYTVPQPLLR